MSSGHEPRIEELESRLAFLDDTVEHLNGVVARQDREIRELQQRVSDLLTRLDELGASGGDSGTDTQHEIPPHY